MLPQRDTIHIGARRLPAVPQVLPLLDGVLPMHATVGRARHARAPGLRGRSAGPLAANTQAQFVCNRARLRHPSRRCAVKICVERCQGEPRQELSAQSQSDIGTRHRAAPPSECHVLTPAELAAPPRTRHGTPRHYDVCRWGVKPA